MLQSHAGMQADLILLAWKSPNYWVRLSCQRVINYLLSTSEGVKALGINDKESTLKFMYKMLSVLNFPYVTEIMCKKLLENLDAICRQVDHDDLVKVFKKASYIGRRILVSSLKTLLTFHYREIKLIKRN